MDLDLYGSTMVRILARMPDLWNRLLRDHVPDVDHICIGCRGTTGGARWPCRSWEIADAAQTVAAYYRNNPSTIDAAPPARHRLRDNPTLPSRW